MIRNHIRQNATNERHTHNEKLDEYKKGDLPQRNIQIHRVPMEAAVLTLTIRDRSPSRARCRTIKANLIRVDSFDFAELEIFILGGDANTSLSSSSYGAIITKISRMRVVVGCVRHGAVDSKLSW